MTSASLPLYDFAEVRAATDALYRAFAARLRALGGTDVPSALDRARTPEQSWSDPALLFSQTCGYPLTHAFRGRVRVVATPIYAVDGCAPGTYRSAIIVHADAPFTRIDELRDAVAAVNEDASHSGCNVLYATLGRAFRAVHVSGSHEASLGLVARGEAEVAAIDVLTLAILRRYRPSAAEGTRVIALTRPAPAPPYVTRATAGPDEIAQLRRALDEAMTDPDTREAREALFLGGTIALADDAYEEILAIEREHVEESAPSSART